MNRGRSPRFETFAMRPGVSRLAFIVGAVPHWQCRVGVRQHFAEFDTRRAGQRRFGN